MTSAVVVGAGIVGASVAWRLAARGADVTVLDQFEAGHTRGSSHGSSRIYRLAYPEPIYVGLARRALGLWRELEDVTGRRVLTTTGAVDHGDPAMIAALRATLAAEGVAHEVLPAAAAGERWPGLRFDGDVLFHPDGGRLFADDAVAASLAAAEASGARVRRGARVDSVAALDDGRAEVRLSDGETSRADVVVVAAGGWAASLLAGLPLPPLVVTQEQTAHFRVTEDAGEWPAFIHHPHAGAGGHGVSPATAAVYGLADTGSDGSEGVKAGFHAIGGAVDPDRHDATPDPVVHQRLLDYAAEWLPGADATSAEAVTCRYTLTPDHHFVIDRHGPIVVAAGFSGHGFKFGPALGELVARLALDGAATPSLFAFGPRPSI